MGWNRWYGQDHMLACDYVGIVSGNNEPDKMKKAGFTTTKSEFVDAPVINELPIAYDTSEFGYYTMGERIGTAFKDGAKLK